MTTDEATIRVATAADLAAIHPLVESAYRGESARGGWTHEADLLDGQRTDSAGLAAILADSDQRLLLACAAGEIVGCVQVSTAGPKRAALGMLAVSPQRQTGGIGRMLIAAAEEAARGWLGADAIEMTVIAARAELIAYYERRGYARTGETRPFPLDDPRFGLPRTATLHFVVLAKPLAG